MLIRTEQAERDMVVGLHATINNLEAELVKALELADENINKAVAAREEQLAHAKTNVDRYEAIGKDLKEMMDMNLDFARRNVLLEQELELARNDALLLR